MQDALFPDDELPERSQAKPVPPALKKPAARAKTGGLKVNPQTPAPAHLELAEALPELARLGTSSWTYPGWNGLVWDGDYAENQLSKHGLAAYAQHPLFRTVSLDRAFYRPLTAAQYAAYAAQVSDDFRFVVKAPAVVTDATVRTETGRAMQANPAFLSPELAVQDFVLPAMQGLNRKLGALVFQISPLPAALHARLPELLQRLAAMLQALPPLASEAPDAVVAVEVRDPLWLRPEFAAVLREAGATYCLGLHAKMPPIEGQLPLLRALWPGPLVCRWNLHRMHGAYGYEDAANRYLPYDRLVDEDLETRAMLARVINATTRAGHHAYVTLSNKAEGCAPLSVAALAAEIQAQRAG
ncbi:DUF72 domain-containing protein [Polaromonas jejuensis]|uniref:DUF72 domain-containing protein n=1 Tax=Polaromonas jejuensis TaxID=457502 RepID=A0ABW0QDS8_9BURK|nr:DUF72 domain-containing protein [Polaromonas jejuensis]